MQKPTPHQLMRPELHAEVSNEVRSVVMTLLEVWKHMDARAKSADAEMTNSEEHNSYIDAIKAMSELAGKLTTLTMLDVQPSRMRERTEPERIEP